MNKRPMAIALCLALTAIVAVAFTTKNQKANNNSQANNPTQSLQSETQLKNVGQTSASFVPTSNAIASGDKQIPQLISKGVGQHLNIPQEVKTRVTYEGLFRFVDAIIARIETKEGLGQEAHGWRHYFRRQAKLSEAQDQILKEVTVATLNQIKVLDERAGNITRNYREQNGNGRLSPGQTLPPLPAEINQLQAQRESIIMQAQQELKDRLGDDGFNKLQLFLRQEITPRVSTVSLREQMQKPIQSNNQ